MFGRRRDENCPWRNALYRCDTDYWCINGGPCLVANINRDSLYATSCQTVTL